MRCPRCGHDLGEGLLPSRCPKCGHGLANATDRPRGRHGARRAAASRAGVEGLSGKGRGRYDVRDVVKRVVRLLVAFALMAAFAGVVYLALWQAEVVGGTKVPDVGGWRYERAVSELESKGFSTQVVEVTGAGADADKVMSTEPAAGVRAEPGSTVTVNVAKPGAA